MQRLTALLLIALVSFTHSRSAFSAVLEWSQWRGPHRDGMSGEVGLLKAWPAQGPPLMWKSKALGAGYGSVSASADRLFAMGESDGASFVMALKQSNGES